MKCRFCGQFLKNVFVDLDSAPLSNSFLEKGNLNLPEVYYPLKAWVCSKCFLVQLDEYRRAKEIFDDKYIYFSSYSKTWLTHCEQYSKMITKRLGLSNKSQVIEVASNDGYLLQFFSRSGIPVLGIEPAGNTAAKAKEKGIKTIVDFFGKKLAIKLKKEGIQADLLIGNNVLAHVPDINDFVGGLKICLKEDGIVTMEFPHLMQLIEKNQFDTIYHEHFSYFSLQTVCRIFQTHGLEIFDVEELGTHGGSLRIYVKHVNDKTKKIASRVSTLLNKEKSKGLSRLKTYEAFHFKVERVKYNLLNFLIEMRRTGKKIVAYGAAAKGNTLLNFCGIKKDIIPYVVDKSLQKQGKFLPGSHIPVAREDSLKKTKPDYILILPWNIKNEIMEQLIYTRKWGARFVVPIPYLKII